MEVVVIRSIGIALAVCAALLLAGFIGSLLGTLKARGDDRYIPVEPTMPFPPYYFFGPPPTALGPCGTVIEAPLVSPPWE